jgi:hypothetical protein
MGLVSKKNLLLENSKFLGYMKKLKFEVLLKKRKEIPLMIKQVNLLSI